MEPVNPRSTLRYELVDNDTGNKYSIGGTRTATLTEAKRRELHKLVDELPLKAIEQMIALINNSKSIAINSGNVDLYRPVRGK